MSDRAQPPRSRATERRVRAYIGLGANLGDAAGTLAWAVARLDALPAMTIRGVSRLYATAPWGVPDQPEFRNAAVAVDVGGPTDPDGAALDLLTRLKTIEREAGRRPGRPWGPRELDLDLLIFGRHRITLQRPVEGRSIDAVRDPRKMRRRLEVPHRDLGERLFVLAPLADLAPGLVPPGWTETIESRRRSVLAAEPAGSVRVLGAWDASNARWRLAPSA